MPEVGNSSEDVRARKAQLLEVSGMWLRDGRPAVFLQFGHLGEVEPPVVISTWDAFRLSVDLVRVLGTILPNDPRIVPLLNVGFEVDPPVPEGHEASDGSLGPWPPLSAASPPVKKRKRRKP